jgi:glycoside/pentoside/hexuronide:cation symporter, GPH family
MALRLLGLMPANQTDTLFYVLFGAQLIDEFAGMVAAILLSSMAVDLVEDSQVKTGRRSEGLLFAADNLLQKAVAGVGVFFSGLMLTLVSFPAKARPSAVPQETLHALGSIYLLVVVPMYALAMLCLLAYRIDRTVHETNLNILKQQS